MTDQYKKYLQGFLLFLSIFPYLSLHLSFASCQSSTGLTGVADRWQSHFHSGVPPCYLGAKPCNSYKCHIKSQPGRREWQSDGEASHNHHYLCLCGWHPQIEMCSSGVPVQRLRHIEVATISAVSHSNLLLDTDCDSLHKFKVLPVLHLTATSAVTSLVMTVIVSVIPILINGDNDYNNDVEGWQ